MNNKVCFTEDYSSYCNNLYGTEYEKEYIYIETNTIIAQIIYFNIF